MNRYQGYVLVGGIALVLLVVVLLVLGAYGLREARKRRQMLERLEAIQIAQWVRRSDTKSETSYVVIEKIARWGPNDVLTELVAGPIRIGSVLIGEPNWQVKLDELKFEADQRVFQLNLESVG